MNGTNIRNVCLFIIYITSIGILTATSLQAGISRISDDERNDNERESVFIEWNLNKNSEVIVSSSNDLLKFSVYPLYYSVVENKVFHLMNDVILHTGDRYKIVVIPKQKSYVYIFQTDMLGNIGQLLPCTPVETDSDNPSNLVKKSVTYYIPARDLSFELSEETNIRIHFLASQEQNIILERLYQNVLSNRHHKNILRKELTRTELLETIKKESLYSFSFHIDIKDTIPRGFDSKPLTLISQEGAQTTDEIVRALSKPIRMNNPEIDLTLTKSAPLTHYGQLLNIRVSPDIIWSGMRVGALILFYDDSDVIRAESFDLLREYGKAFQEDLRDAVFVVAGNVPYSGNGDDYDIHLSQRRAEAVKRFLLSEFDIAEDRLIVKAFGSADQIYSNETIEGQIKNSRIEFFRIK